MSKFEIMSFVRIINDYFEKNNFRFYATVEDGGVGIRYLSDKKIDYRPLFKYYSYATILRLNDVIIEHFLNNLGLEIKLDILTEVTNE